MTETQARWTANVILAAAAVGAAAAMVASPVLRRLVWRVSRRYAAGPLAVYAATVVHEAWHASAPPVERAAAVRVSDDRRLPGVLR